MSKFSFSRFIYLDTCIFSELLKKRRLIRPFFDFLVQNDLCIAVSQALWLELSPKKKTHQMIDAILTLLPSAIIKSPEKIINEEISSHPNYRKDSLLKTPLNQLIGKQIIQQKLSDTKTFKARSELRRYSKYMAPKLNQIKSNFQPSKSGKYLIDRAESYANQIIFQWLLMDNPSFVLQFRGNVSRFNTDVFKSIKIFAYFIYYKYYNQRKEVARSDFADLFHLYGIPYSNFVIVERDMCHILNQIKSHHEILNNVIVTNIDFFNELN